MYQRLEVALSWVIRTLRPIPGLAWILFAILWFGVEQPAAIFIIAIGVWCFKTHGFCLGAGSSPM
jgi:NitT/TauT family transport system permease protein